MQAGGRGDLERPAEDSEEAADTTEADSAGGSHDLEVSEADVAEQRTPLRQEGPAQVRIRSFETPEADAVDQARLVEDDEGYDF
ncbi:MAG: hypothetical protein KatS3mg008_2182 [Acidimicrobiales bacterium]|nr:MAG: hypothetical protein KatS3mg008_2182 [Acidimicrobiales bacterium]